LVRAAVDFEVVASKKNNHAGSCRFHRIPNDYLMRGTEGRGEIHEIYLSGVFRREPDKGDVTDGAANIQRDQAEKEEAA
jgi:hypothetical protein